MRTEILGVKAPLKECTDKKCPFHGEIVPKDEIFKGVVARKDINRSATIEWSRRIYVPKYERYETRRSRMRVHNPACLNAEVGEQVVAARTRPLSKTKNHVIISVLGKVKEGVVVLSDEPRNKTMAMGKSEKSGSKK